MSQRTCKRTEVYPRYLRSNAARAPKHRLWEPPQNDRQSWPSTFGCEMFTVNVCVESCLHRVIITSAIERNVKRWRLQPGRLRYQPRTLCVSSRIALARTVPRCALCVAPTHALLSTEDGQALVARRVQARRTEVCAHQLPTLPYLLPGRPSLPIPPGL